MDQKQLTELIDKYLSGKCTPEEARIVEQWYDGFQQTRETLYTRDSTAAEVGKARSIANIRAKLGLLETTDKVITLKKSKPVYRWLAAASILVILAIGAMFLVNTRPETFSIQSTNIGQTRHIRLPDGTDVWLNAGSTLRYSSAYNKNNREVYLNGEAFFDVVHNVDRPFNIYSGKIKTHVLGTAFSVSAYPDALVNTVTVLRGKVQVSHEKQVLSYLLPGEEIDYEVASGRSIVNHVNAENVVAWKSGKLSFVEMPMQDIAVHLQKWYGVSFVFKNQALKNRKFTASFNNNIGLENLLEVMNEASHVSYQVNKKTKTVTYL